ncbi:hypothetical protein Tco_0560237, partial [Tanacetum coccineum]
MLSLYIRCSTENTRASALTSPLPFCDQDIEEEPCDFLLVSSFRILSLANSMMITPSGAELDKDVIKVYQVS